MASHSSPQRPRDDPSYLAPSFISFFSLTFVGDDWDQTATRDIFLTEEFINIWFTRRNWSPDEPSYVETANAKIQRLVLMLPSYVLLHQSIAFVLLTPLAFHSSCLVWCRKFHVEKKGPLSYRKNRIGYPFEPQYILPETAPANSLIHEFASCVLLDDHAQPLPFSCDPQQDRDPCSLKDQMLNVATLL